MNKYQEAINFINEEHHRLLDKYNIGGGFGNHLIAMLELVERATPTEPIYKMNSYNYNQPYCGRCNSMVESNSYKYCHYCGQQLDWSDK